MEDLNAKIRTDCHDKKLDTFAYSYIYSKRIAKIDILLKVTKVLGILIPVLLGGIVGAYYNNTEVMKYAIIITSPLAIIQLVFSVALTVLGTEENLTKYISKSTKYSALNSEFEQLANYPIDDLKEYSKKYELLVERERNIGEGNFDISDKEKRMGMRYGLRNYKRSCYGCKEIPLSMEPSKCNVCGNF